MSKFFKALFSLLTAAVVSVSAMALPAAAADTSKTAQQAVDDMGAGWNLGNAFDASDCSWLSNEMDYESAWNGEKTTKELIKAVKDMGFKTIRIPVSWHNHVDKNYNISSAWMKRVKTVVQWCLDEDMYVILNTHHDISTSYIYPDNAHYAQSEKYIKAIWKQLSAEFKDTGDKLIFESMNEVRAVGTNNEWWFDKNNIPKNVQEYISCINKLNQAFVDTVRAGGGKNASRFLMIPGYATSTDGITNKYFTMPTDTAKDKLMVTVHIYTEKSSEYQSLINAAYNKFTAKGIPVVIGEFGTVIKTDAKKRAEIEGATAAYARSKGMIVVRWDNNAFTGNSETYGLIDRKTLKWKFEDIAKAIVKNSAGKSSVSAPSSSSSSSASAKPASDKLTLTAAKASSDSIRLTWNKADTAYGYRIYVYDSAKKGYVSCVTLSNGSSSTLGYTIKDLKKGTYKYVIAPIYKNGNTITRGDISSSVSVTL